MPVHDWTLVEAGIYHAFHTGWTGALQQTLNEGLLPEGYYALAEQHASRAITDILTLHTSPETWRRAPLPPAAGGIELAEAPPRVSRTFTADPAGRRRSLAIRHVSGHRLIAVVDIVSPSNKNRPLHVEQLVDKAVSLLEYGVHLVLIDLFPPGPHDPAGIHGSILAAIDEFAEPYAVPTTAPLTLASYDADSQVDIYIEHLAVGDALVEMPLFLEPERYVNVPLESTYESTYRGMPAFWREVLEGRPPRDS